MILEGVMTLTTSATMAMMSAAIEMRACRRAAAAASLAGLGRSTSNVTGIARDGNLLPP
jgi:hypothetical protein